MNHGILYIVATPIGNLDDLSRRAVQVLGAVDLVACEDTRKSRVLLARHHISTRIMSLHRFSEARKTGAVLDHLRRGQAVALISDAGAPGVADPGSRVVRAALDEGLPVRPIPGPSAITAALSASGMDASSFRFLGFVPKRRQDRQAFFEHLIQEQSTAVFFDTPVRILDSLAVASEVFPDRALVLFRELTKLYEEILPGSVRSVWEELRSRPAIKGEITLVLEGAPETRHQTVDTKTAIRSLMEEGLSGKHLAVEAHRRFGLRKAEAYETFLALKQDDS